MIVRSGWGNMFAWLRFFVELMFLMARAGSCAYAIATSDDFSRRGCDSKHDPDGKPIYARDKVTREIKRNAKGEKIIGSPGFGLVVLHWRKAGG